MGFWNRQRRQEHPESWIFGPRRSVRRDLTESLAENGRSLRWTVAVGAGVVGLLGVSAVVAPMSPVSLVGSNGDGGGTATAPATVGVPEGTELTPTGKLVVKEDGAVIDAKDVRGAIWVQADDVRITRTRITGSSYHTVRVFDGADRTVIEDSDVVCTDDALNGGKGVVFGNYTATRIDVTGCGKAFVTASGNVRVVDSYADGQRVDLDIGGSGPPPTTAPTPSTTAPGSGPPTPTTTAPPGPPTTTPRPTTTNPSPPTTTPPSPPPANGRFPDASTTGVPAGVTLRPSGSVTVSSAGAVLENLHITGSVTVNAANVTIRNSLIDNTGTYPIKVGSGGSVVVEDSEIDGNGTASVAILPGKYTLRRVDIYDVRDGPRIEGDDVVIEDSYIHHLHRVPDGHHDAIQIRKGSNITIRRNNLQAYNADTGDPMNAAIQIGSLTAPMRNLVVDGNLMNGGNYTINSGKSGSDPSYYRNNVFGRNFRYGILSSGPGVVWDSSNVWQDTGQPVR